MTLHTAVQTKEAITSTTGLLARVAVVNGSFEAQAVLPSCESKLSRQQQTALYAVFVKGAEAADKSIGIATAMGTGIFDSRVQCVAVFDGLQAFGWLRELNGRYSLSDKGAAFVAKKMGGAA